MTLYDPASDVVVSNRRMVRTWVMLGGRHRCQILMGQAHAQLVRALCTRRTQRSASVMFLCHHVSCIGRPAHPVQWQLLATCRPDHLYCGVSRSRLRDFLHVQVVLRQKQERVYHQRLQLCKVHRHQRATGTLLMVTMGSLILRSQVCTSGNFLVNVHLPENAFECQ